MEGKKSNARSNQPAEPGPESRTHIESDTRIDLLYNRDGQVWLLHDKPLPQALICVEYDTNRETVSLISEKGRIGDSLRISPERGYYLERAMDVTALLMKDGFVVDFSVVPMTTTRMTLN